MKKTLFTLVALLVGFTASAKSYTNNIGWGLRAPAYSKIEIDAPGYNGENELWPAGFDVQYLGYFDNGFSIKGNFDLSFSWVTVAGKEEDMFSVAATERIGLGYGIVRTEKVYFGMFGFLGVDSTVMFKSIGPNDLYTVCTRVIVGADPTIVFTPGKTFSLYGSCGVGVGFGTATAEVKGPNSSSKNFDLEPSFVMYPVIGMSWKF